LNIKEKKILFASDTGYGNIYKELGKKYGPIDVTFINIGAYNFYPMMPIKDKSTYHTSPEEALNIGKDLKSKKMIGMHWGTVVLSLEPIMEPPKRFKEKAKDFWLFKR
jgi:L-ascorbate metabolism protein UlaG (beta-lactamase superfamily)